MMSQESVLRADLPSRDACHLPCLVGTSEPMAEVLRQIARAAKTDTNVCVYGEPGTGKELVARAIHYASRRANRPLIVFDCSATPEGLAETELFGHVKGSFLSAVADREGMFELAQGGSLLFDEIGELSPALQAKLAKVILRREFRRVGGIDPIRTDVRILAASTRNLPELVDARRFRRDLLSCVEGMTILLPPLRLRKEDIPVLVDHFIQRFSHHNEKQIRGVSLQTMGALLRYDWPHNIRELENCIERAAVACDRDTLDVADLSLYLKTVQRRAEPAPPEKNSEPRSLKDAERDFIVETLRRLKGDRVQTARLLGISLRSLYYKLKGIEPGQVPPARRRVYRTRQSTEEFPEKKSA